jgi:hypothetical protein
LKLDPEGQSAKFCNQAIDHLEGVHTLNNSKSDTAKRTEFMARVSETILNVEYFVSRKPPYKFDEKRTFVVHDQLWNLIPTKKSANSKKSDLLPSEKYLDAFVNIQHRALLQSKILFSEKVWRDYENA